MYTVYSLSQKQIQLRLRQERGSTDPLLLFPVLNQYTEGRQIVNQMSCDSAEFELVENIERYLVIGGLPAGQRAAAQTPRFVEELNSTATAEM